MSMVDKFGPRYRIDSISPVDACVGDTVTIRGSGFGSAGRVYFESPGDPALPPGGAGGAVLGGVAATRWTDTQIEVVVPPWATAGELHLNAYTVQRDLRGRMLSRHGR